MRSLHAVAASLAVLVAPAMVSAQQANWATPAAGSPARFTLGAVGLLAAPRGEFQDNLGKGVQGGGFNVFGLLRLDGTGVLSLRMEGGGVWYGSESQRVQIFSARVGGKVVTRNSIAELGIGPELSVPLGPVRPYVNAMYGLHYFETASSLEGFESDNNSNDFSTTQQHDATSTYGFGGGLRIPVGPRRQDFSIDIGTRYYRGGEAEYLKKGDIVDNPDGSLSLNTRRSQTNFQTFYVGVSIGLHPSSPSKGRSTY